MTDGDTGGYRTIHDLAGDERPREKLLRHGPGVLSDAELIAIIAGSGTRGENVLDLARGLLDAHGGLGGLLRADAKALQRTRGLGPAKAAQLAAAIELGRRMPRVDGDARPMLTSPGGPSSTTCAATSGGAPARSCRCSAPTPVAACWEHRPSSPAASTPSPCGSPMSSTTRSCSRRPRSSSPHNHPSGRATPSPRDIELTRDIAATGQTLGIKLHDHLVIAGEHYVSMKREGLLGA